MSRVLINTSKIMNQTSDNMTYRSSASTSGANNNNNNSGNTDSSDNNKSGQQQSSSAATNTLAADEMIEMLKNLAAVNEKLYKWEQSVKKLDTYPNNDINKTLMKDIMDFIDNDKSSTQDKAIYLYGQLAHKCHQQKNYMGAAKAYERAATLRFDSTNLMNDSNLKDTKTTIQYLESAIVNYDAIHKYRHAGTLHYRCSKILRLMNAASEEVAKHYCQALEYFTMRNHEVKHRKRIDGLKISCYSSSNINHKRKWDSSQQRCCRDIDFFVSKYSRFTTTTTESHDECDSNRSTDNEDSQGAQDYMMSGSNCPKSGGDLFDMNAMTGIGGIGGIGGIASSAVTTMASNISITHNSVNNSQSKHQSTNRCIQDRIESAKKLVKKLHKFCPFYEVATDGDDAGRVYCKICERHLGAVSSTLKNHVNTQEHKQAVEDSISIGNSGQSAQPLRQALPALPAPPPPIPTAIPIRANVPAITASMRPVIHQLVPQQQQQQQQQQTNSFDFESAFDMQWPYQSSAANAIEYCLTSTGGTAADMANSFTNATAVIQNRTITSL